MRPNTRPIVIMTLTLVLGLTAVPAGAAPSGEPNPGQPIYLALGDSWAYGQGATDPATAGYVAQLHWALRQDLDCLPATSPLAADGCKHLQRINLARPATATLPGVTTPLVASEQLPVALPLLAGRNGDRNPRNDVEVVTLQVGGNDVTGPILAACLAGFTPECAGTIVGEMAAYEADLRGVVDALREAAGPDTPIVLGTYDNTVPFCDLGAIPGAEQLGAVVLEGTPDGAIDGVHDVIRRVAADHAAVVAEVFGTLGANDFVGGSDCLHVTTTGHRAVKDAFVHALDL